MLAHLLTVVLAQVPAADTVHVPSAWQTPAAVYGGLTLLVTLALWAVRQAFYIYNMKRDQQAFRDATIGNRETGAKGAIPEIVTDVAQLEAAIKAVVLRIEQVERDLRERPWCASKHEQLERHQRDSAHTAHEAVRKLEGRVVDAEKTTIQLSSDVKTALRSLEELKAMLLQLGHDVNVIALNRAQAIPRQTSKLPPDEG